MRTRFLNIDYFASSSVGTLRFLSLPVPRLSSTTLIASNENHFLRWDSLQELPCGIERLPIQEDTLSKFFSDVLPDRVDAEYGEKHFGGSANGSDERWSSNVVDSILFQEALEALCDTKKDERQRESLYGAKEKTDQTFADDGEFEVCQFETPELDLALGKIRFNQEEEKEILSEVQEIRDARDHNVELRDAMDAIMSISVDAQGAIYLVDYLSSNDFEEQKASEVEYDDAFQNQMLSQRMSIFPVLEVDEMSFSMLPSSPLENELLSVLECVSSTCCLEENPHMNGQELLRSKEYDNMEFPPFACYLKQCLESEILPAYTSVDMDIRNMLETQQVERSSVYDQEKENVDPYFSIMPVEFEEFQLLDMEVSRKFDGYLSPEKTTEPEIWMFKEELNFKNFDDLIVSHELVLADDTFKSLPIPVLYDHDKIKRLCIFIKEKLLEQKPEPLSTSDKIYLDWHLLDVDEDNCTISSFYHHMLGEAGCENFCFDEDTLDAKKVLSDFILSDGAVDATAVDRDEGLSNVILERASMPEDHITKVTSAETIGKICSKQRNEEQIEVNADRASAFFKSVSTSNHLAFFLNPQNPVVGGNRRFSVGTSRTHAANTEVSSSDSKTSRMPTDLQTERQNIIFHNVKLSENINALIGNLGRSYIDILHKETELISVLPLDKLQLLRVPKEKLKDWVRKKTARGKGLVSDENIIFATLCAIKQISWYLCFYGIHVTHLYLGKLCQMPNFTRFRLESLYSQIDMANEEVEKDISRSHPSLTVIQRILQSNTPQKNFRALILAEQVFWCSLKRLLMSIGLSCNELYNYYKCRTLSDTDPGAEFTVADIGSLLVSDCLLASYEQISASFPLEKFSLILEYGGSNGSPRISSPLLASLPRLHFIKVELDGSSACAALCEGVDMPQKIKIMDAESTSETPDEIKERGLEEFLNFVPLENTCGKRYSETGEGPEPFAVPQGSGTNTETIQYHSAPFPSTVVVVNTQYANKKMIVCRRSTYQKILAMEKEGVQVMERDSDLPVDLILTSSTCLLWYHHTDIGGKSTPDELFSSLSLLMENLAANVLTLLSFTFSSCILVFEGDNALLSMVMESSDELYAAAGSLDMNFQLFCSSSANLTDEVILNCISSTVQLTKGLYTKMPESETLAESFLTKFPSVNPLTAHAILSSGGTLNDFFKLSRDRRIQILQRYFVPDESVDLFSALCIYSDRDDSKSVMTGCNSSVSSGLDSEFRNLNSDFRSRTQEHASIIDKVEKHGDDLPNFGPSNQFTNFLNASEVFKELCYWSSKRLEMFDDYKKPASLDGIFGKLQDLDFDVEKTFPSASRRNANEIHKSSPLLEEMNKWDLNFEKEVLVQNKESEAAVTEMDWSDMRRSQTRDSSDNPFPSEDFFFSAGNLTCFSPLLPVERDQTKTPNIARELSFSSFSYPSFPTAAEIDFGSEAPVDTKETRQNSQRIGHRSDEAGNDGSFPSKRRKTFLEEVLTKKSTGSERSPLKDELSPFRGTPLSNAVRSSQLPPGSSWTIEFLNKVKEKSRSRQQALSRYQLSPACRPPGNVSKATKRKSPSILEFFKYQGGTATQAPQKKRLRKAGQSSTSFNHDSYPNSSGIWTQKKAKQILSFATNASEGQAKLVKI